MFRGKDQKQACRYRTGRTAVLHGRAGRDRKDAVRTTTQTSRGSQPSRPWQKSRPPRRREPPRKPGKHHQAGGRGCGPAWVTTPQGGGKGQSPMVGDFRALQACCQTGRRTGAGTRAIRSHLPRSASLNQRQPAAPPSTRLTHMMQRKMVIRIPGLVSGAAFQRLAMVTAALPVTRHCVSREAADLVHI